MNDAKWESLIETLQQRYGDFDVVTEDILSDTVIGPAEELPTEGYREIIEIDTPAGSFRLVRENRPTVLGSKFHYSHRQGDAARTEYILSDTEMAHKFYVYLLDPDTGDWQAIDSGSFGI